MNKIKKIVLSCLIFVLSAITLSTTTEQTLRTNLTNAGVKKASIDEYIKILTNNNITEVEKILNNAIKLDPKNYYAKEDLAAVYLTQNGKENEAVKLLEEALKVDSKNHVPYINLLQASAWLNKGKEYVDTLNGLVNNIPEYPDGYRLAGIFLLNNKKNEEAIPYIEKAVELYSKLSGDTYPELTPNKNLLLADSYALEITNYAEMGRHQRAIDLFSTRRSTIKNVSPETEEKLLEVVKKSNETFNKSATKKVYDSNLKKLGLKK